MDYPRIGVGSFPKPGCMPGSWQVSVFVYLRPPWNISELTVFCFGVAEVKPHNKWNLQIPPSVLRAVFPIISSRVAVPVIADLHCRRITSRDRLIDFTSYAGSVQTMRMPQGIRIHVEYYYDTQKIATNTSKELNAYQRLRGISSCRRTLGHSTYYSQPLVQNLPLDTCSSSHILSSHYDCSRTHTSTPHTYLLAPPAVIITIIKQTQINLVCWE